MGFGANKKHSKVGKTTLRAFHFRLDLSALQAMKLHQTLDLGWELRNRQALILEANRKECSLAKQRGEKPHYISAADLKKRVAKSELHPKFQALHSQVRQDLSLRVSEGQQRWLEAIKEGHGNVSPPGAIPRKRFRSLCYPQYGTAANITDGRLHLSKLGVFRVIGWRKMRGAKKTLTVKFKEGQWWAIVMCEIQERDVCRPYAEVQHLPEIGLDPGIHAVLVDSTGTSYATPRPLKIATAKLRHIQKDVSRKFEMRKSMHVQNLAAARESGARAPVAEGLVESLRKIPYSNRLKANIKKLARAHTKVERIRLDAARKTARNIEQKASRVAVEEHGLKFMMGNRKLSKATADVAIGRQKQVLASAMGRGRYHKASNRRPEGGNSQTCLCGARVPKSLRDRWHKCLECGLEGPRDQVSAIIVQHTAFGSVPEISKNGKKCMPGLGVLERAANALKTRRGEVKGAGGESHRAKSRRATVLASEVSVKRPTQRYGSKRKTVGAGYSASTEVNTTRHVDSIDPCVVEAKDRLSNESFSILESDAFGSSRSTILQVGE